MTSLVNGLQNDIFPEIEPFRSGFLKVSYLHEIYYEECGKQDGKPIIFVHGGPGGSFSSRDRRFFDPNVYRIILFDQRGSGKSKPPAELEDNNTWKLIEDMEQLRKHLEVKKWVLFGGSWGSTLSLAYSQAHPDNVKAMILRGIFTLRRKELTWFYQEGGADRIFPDYWEEFIQPIPIVERHDLMNAYYRRLIGGDQKLKLELAKKWSQWEMHTGTLIHNQESVDRIENDEWCLQFARIESHYFVHGGFMKSENQLLDEVDKIRHIPCTIIQGRYDIICPADTAWQLHKRWPEADFKMIANAGHASKESGITYALIQATDKYKTL